MLAWGACMLAQGFVTNFTYAKCLGGKRLLADDISYIQRADARSVVPRRRGGWAFPRRHVRCHALRISCTLVKTEFASIRSYYLSCWYKRKEFGLRASIFFSAATVSGAFGGLIAAGIGSRMVFVGGRQGWAWIFIMYATFGCRASAS